MIKKIISLIAIIVLTITLIGCGGNGKNNSKNSKIKVLVSFHAIKELTSLIGGDKIQLESVVPSGTEAHDFEPKVSNVRALADADVFIYNGANMEEWVDGMLQSASNKNIEVIKLTDTAKLIPLSSESINILEEGSEIEKTEAHDSNQKGAVDPHIWLSLKESETALKVIKDALIKTDPKNKDYYEKNYQKNYNKLESLYNEYKEKFNTVQNKLFVAGHEAFAYLCRDFGLKQVGVEDAFASGDPSPAKLKALVDYSKKNNIKTIFGEDYASGKISDTLAKEAGARVEKLVTFEASGDYLKDMQDNLEKIYKGIKG